MTALATACGTTSRTPPPPVVASNTSASQAAATSPASAPSSVPPAPTAAPSGLPAFDLAIKNAERVDGLIPIWKKQDKVYLEVSPALFGKPLFLSPKLSTGLGEARLYGGLMQDLDALTGRPQWVEFRQVQQQVQLIAVNSAFTAKIGSPQARAVEAAFSPSLLGSMSILTAPQAKTGAVLVDASAVFVTDILGLAPRLQRTYRQSYAFDAKNSSLSEVRPEQNGLFLEVQQHFGTASIALPNGTPGPVPTYPTAVPDPRSLFITAHYSLTPLPDMPMVPRVADQRVGYFTTAITDFSDDLARNPRKHYINRWQLEKKDPAAAMSLPVKPIVFWLDPSIPLAYRGAIKEGVLEWNKAFAAIGFEQAIEVKEAPTDKPFDTLATGHPAIRWMTNISTQFGASGPTHVDPRSGEILDASIALESLSTRAARAIRRQFISVSNTDQAETHDHTQCEYGSLGAEQLGYAIDLQAPPAGLAPDSPEVEAFVLAYLKSTTMHEVGHTLGLRHNFRASRWRTLDELNNKALTEREGNSASVMDYAPINLPMPGKHGGALYQTTLGPYDYWAVEYGYKPLPNDLEGAKTLTSIAQRSDEPAHTWDLAFGTDEDASLGLDPGSLTFDLGRDPVEFAKVRIAIFQDQLQKLTRQPLRADEAPADLRRKVAFALGDVGRASTTLLRQIGGLSTRRDGASSGRDLLEPLPPEQQRRALDLLIKSFLSPQSLQIPAALQRRLAPDFLVREDNAGDDAAGNAIVTDFSVADQLLIRQRQVLSYLMNEGLADRLGDNLDKTRDRGTAGLSALELHQRIQKAVWSTSGDLPEQAPWRRNLQREYVNRLTLYLLRGGSIKADTRSAFRDQATRTLAQLKAGAGNKRGGGIEDRAEQLHRQDCIDTLERALQASVVRASP